MPDAPHAEAADPVNGQGNANNLPNAEERPARLRKTPWNLILGTVSFLDVVMMITMLVMAALTDSPIEKGKKQRQPSKSCPKARQYEIWVCCAIVRYIWDAFNHLWLGSRNLYRQRREQRAPMHQDIEAAARRAAAHVALEMEPLEQAPEPEQPEVGRQVALTLPAGAEPPIPQPVNIPPELLLINDPPMQQLTARQLRKQEARRKQAVKRIERLARRRERRKGFVQKLDQLVEEYDGYNYIFGMGLWMAGLWVAYDSARTGVKCAPLLWWAIIAVTINGWLVVLFICVGCLLSMTSTTQLVRMAVHPGRATAFQAERLMPSDLPECKIVAYVPDANEATPTPSVYSWVEDESTEEEEGRVVPRGAVDHSRLPVPAVVLQARLATCSICYDSFAPPREVTDQHLYVTPYLRQLPCGHVFHQECVDGWLLDHSASCPFCNRNVMTMINERNEQLAGP